MIPQADPGAFVRAHRADIDEAIARVLDSGWYILGPEVAAFEAEFARFLRVSRVVTVANGTEALWLALLTAGIGPGDEVILPALTASATAAAVVQSGATPVFADVRPTDLTLDPEAVRAALSPRTRVVLPVHLYGNPADLLGLMEICARPIGDRPILLIEDCAQAHGAAIDPHPFPSPAGRGEGVRVGSVGELAAFSFYPTKNLGALGDGGAIATDDDALADRLILLRQYGWEQRYNSAGPGWNSRLDEIQAALLRLRLERLPADNQRRATIAAAYRAGLDPERFPSIHPAPGTTGVYHLFVVRIQQRDSLIAYLARRGIGAAVHYPVPCHLQPAFSRFGRGSEPCALPVTEAACREVLSLPMYPELDEEQVARVISACNDFPGE